MSSYNCEEEVWKLPEQDYTWDVTSELALYQVYKYKNVYNSMFCTHYYLINQMYRLNFTWTIVEQDGLKLDTTHVGRDKRRTRTMGQSFKIIIE